MKFNELDNEELVFFFMIIEDMLKAYSEVLAEKGMKHVVDSPIGKLQIFQEFTEEELDKINNGDKVRLFRSIHSKLKPIVELIGDSNPNLLDKIEQVLSIKTDEDTSEEEDL